MPFKSNTNLPPAEPDRGLLVAVAVAVVAAAAAAAMADPKLDEAERGRCFQMPPPAADLGFFPLSNIFFLALIPTQFTI